MAGTGGTPLTPLPVSPPGGGVIAWIGIGLVGVALVALVGVSVAGQPGSSPGSQAAVGGPTATATAAVTAAGGASTTSAPVATRSPTPAAARPRGTPPPRVAVSVGRAATCPPGTDPDAPGPADQARPAGLTIALPSLALDRRAGRLVALTGPETVETWTFDVCTNTWSRMHPDRQPPPGTGQLVYDVDSDVTVASDGTRMWAYDLKTDTWTEKGLFAPFVHAAMPWLRFYDPVSGLVVALGDDGDDSTLGLEMWGYDVDSDTWTPIPQTEPLSIGPHDEDFAYDASVDRLVAYANPWSDAGDGDRQFEATTWLFDLRTGAWSGTGAAAPQFSYGWWGIGPAIAYDEAAERVVMLGQGHSAAYDATADIWETLWAVPAEEYPAACGDRPECRLGRAMVYDPVNKRLVVFGGQRWTGCTWEEVGDIRAFDVPTRAWTLLLPPTPELPPVHDLAADEATASTGPILSPWIRPARVTLHGGPFFTRIPGVADEPWSSTAPASPETIVDGLFLPDCQPWTDGTVWWEQTTADATSKAWVEIDLGGTYAIDAAVVQADANEDYLLSYRDPGTATWVALWSIPPGEAGGMATRPHFGDASIRWALAPPVVTDALRFEATSGDAQYSVSEIAVFGVKAP